jgi:ankyrin repeat protein
MEENNMNNEYGLTPLHVAASKGDTAAAEMLIDKGADVNAKDVIGSTPLTLATFNDHTDMAKLLIERGGK